jgi:predicted TIM-barrel enzyme
LRNSGIEGFWEREIEKFRDGGIDGILIRNYEEDKLCHLIPKLKRF